MTTRVALYARVSTPDQNPAMQVEAMQAEAARRGWIVHDTYIDHGVSGAKDRRPALDRLMAAMRSGEVQAVMVWKFDRMARSVRHLLAVVDEFRANDVLFISLTENIDTSSAIGAAMLIILAAIAQLERDIIRERVLAGVARARRRRSTWGRAQRWTEEDARRAIELRSQGRSWREVAMATHLPVRTIRRAVAAVAHTSPSQTPSA
ncbi:MAG: recombinase family protein [Planctomycetes bacterium]|nr:recombinase family protein [Planctomycetota bacterium]